MIYVLIILFIILLISYICSKQSFFAPAVLVSGIWFVCTLLYITLDHGFNAINGKFPYAIAIWVVSFCFFSLLAQSVQVATPFKNTYPSKIARDIYYYFTLLTLPVLVYNVYIIFNSGLGTNIFSVLRNANISGFEDKGIGRTSAFFVSFWLVSYVIELLAYSKENRWRIIILFFTNIFYAFISMGKINFLTIFIATAIILFYKGVIKLKTLFVGLAVLFFVFLGIQTIRSIKGQDVNAKKFISLYLLSGIPAFEIVQPLSSNYFGENTFRFIYAVNYKLGISKIEPVSPLQAFIPIPHPNYTNVYTIMYPYYKDFGLGGIAVFGSLLGLLFGYVFNRLQHGDLYALTLYSLLIICLLMQFMSDVFFLTLSQNLQYIIIAYLPFYITKHRLFEQKL